MADIQNLTDKIDDLVGRIDDLINNNIAGNNGRGGSGNNNYSGGIRPRVFKKQMEYRDFKNLTGPQDKGLLENLIDEQEILEEIGEHLELNADKLDEIEEKVKNKIELDEEELELLKKKNEYERLRAKTYEKFRLSEGIKDASAFVNNVQGMGKALSGLLDPFRKADEAATKYARAVGMTSAAMKNLRNDTLGNIVDNKLAAKYNMSTDELLAAQSNYMKAAGRNIRVSNSDQENMAAMEMVTKGRGTELAALLDNFGVSMTDTAEMVGRMYADASKEGLSFEKYSENVAKNIKLAQNYTFKNGIKGLESMAKKATAMKMDMQQVSALADNVSTVEGSIDVASKLQVLGGSFAQLADPLAMLNEGLNDMEGLQDRLIKMVGGMGQFNKETGEVQVSSFNKQRIKAAAKAMGVSYDSLMESANAQARRGEIEKQILSNANASGLSDEMKELIKNSGTFKDGKAGVSIRGEFKSLDQLTEADKEALQKETQTESQDIKDIAQDTRSLVEIESGFKKQKDATQANMVKNIGDLYKGLASWLSKQGWLYHLLVAWSATQAIGGALDMFGRGRGSFRRMGRGFKKWAGKIGRGRAGGAASRILGRTGSSLPAGTKLNSAGRLIDARTGRFVSTKGLNAAQGVANKIGTKGITSAAGSRIMKGGIERTAKRAVIKTLGKTAGKQVLGAGAKLAAGGASAALTGGLGIVGAVGDIATEALVANGKIEKGGVGHHIGKGLSGAASGAAIGATIGSIIPGIGTAIGAAVGAIGGAAVGLFKAGTAKEQKKIEDKLKGTGVEMKGDYGRGKLEKINHALKTGYIDERLRKKLEKKGDHDLLALIDKKAEEQRAKGIEPEKMNFHEGIWGKMAKYGLFGPMGMAIGWGNKYLTSDKGKKQVREIRRKLNNSKFGKFVKNAANPKTTAGKLGKTALVATAFGPLGLYAMAGNSIRKKFKEKKEHDAFINKTKGKTAKDILNSYSSNVKPIPEKGANATYGGVDKANKDIHIKTDPHDIHLNGTLNLRGENGQSVDLINDLKKNPDMMRNLAGMVSNEMSVIQKGVNVNQRA